MPIVRCRDEYRHFCFKATIIDRQTMLKSGHKGRFVVNTGGSFSCKHRDYTLAGLVTFQLYKFLYVFLPILVRYFSLINMV